MKRLLFVFLSFIFISHLLWADTFKTDPRRYFTSYDQLGTWPYNIVVQFINPVDEFTYDRDLFYGNKRPSTYCSGGIISPKYVITAGHCVHGKGDPLNIVVFNKKYNEMQIKGHVEYVREGSCADEFAIVKLDVDNKDYQKELDNMHFPTIAKTVNEGDEVINIGFGALRVVSDQDLDFAREVTVKRLQEIIGDKSEYNSDIKNKAKNKLEKGVLNVGEEGVPEMDVTSVINIVNKALYSKGQIPFTVDSNNAKIDNRCKVKDFYAKGYIVNCVAWSNNSGGPLLTNTGGDNYSFVGVMNCGTPMLDTKNIAPKVAGPKVYYDKVMEYLNSENK